MRWPALTLAVLLGAWALPGWTQAQNLDQGNVAQGFQLLDQARRSLDGPKLLQAEQIFSRCLKSEPNNPRCLYGRARANLFLYSFYSEVKKDPAKAQSCFEEAQAAANRAASLLPSNGQVHALLGRLYQVEAALHPFSSLVSTVTGESAVVSEYRRALELDPDNLEAEIGLGSYYLFAPKVAGGNRERAIKHFRRAVKLDPQDPEALTWLAVAYRESGDWEGARQSLDRALALDPSYRFARNENLRLREAENRRGGSSG
ncbi:MAG: hypothetical protein A2V67_05120 [Deltaproteobacteria bacterium RBG_13_61_14]|nr:MAG: hypothetical protein A2V67_05120 [Deltaproteobacteria bacterium RBG_13_61_14]